MSKKCERSEHNVFKLLKSPDCFGWMRHERLLLIETTTSLKIIDMKYREITLSIDRDNVDLYLEAILKYQGKIK